MTVPKFKTIRIEAYKPGRSKVGKLKNIIKLSANESALGISPRAKKALSQKKLNLSKYPDGKSENLRKKYQKYIIVILTKLFCGSGSDEIIQMICQLYLTTSDEVIVPQYSFLMYRIYAKIIGAKIVFAKEKNFKVNVEQIIKRFKKN